MSCGSSGASLSIFLLLSSHISFSSFSLINFETVKYCIAERHETKRYAKSLNAYYEAAVKNQISLTLLNTGQGIIITVRAEEEDQREKIERKKNWEWLIEEEGRDTESVKRANSSFFLEWSLCCDVSQRARSSEGKDERRRACCCQRMERKREQDTERCRDLDIERRREKRNRDRDGERKL
jgi:hypothetical protein